MKSIYNFHYEKKPSCTTTKSTLVTVSKDDWNTKEDTGKNALYIVWYVRRVKTNLNNEKIKSIALSILKLHYACLKASNNA